MGMGAGQAAALSPDIGRAKQSMISVFGLLDMVKHKFLGVVLISIETLTIHSNAEPSNRQWICLGERARRNQGSKISY